MPIHINEDIQIVAIHKLSHQNLNIILKKKQSKFHRKADALFKGQTICEDDTGVTKGHKKNQRGILESAAQKGL